MTDPVEERLRSVLGPVLATLGYDHFVRTVRKGDGLTISYRFERRETEVAWVNNPKVEVYATDAYPNAKGEAFAYVWNGVGFATKGERVVEALNRAGIVARSTKHKGMSGVRFAFDPWA